MVRATVVINFLLAGLGTGTFMAVARASVGGPMKLSRSSSCVFKGVIGSFMFGLISLAAGAFLDLQ
jgi:hypothetical protein